MFDVGFWELMLIGIVALVVIGPERLPGLARKAGFWVGRVRRWVSNVKDDVSRELRAEELRQAIDRNAGLKEIQDIIRQGQEKIDEIKPDKVVKAFDDEVNKVTAESSETPDSSERDPGKQSSDGGNVKKEQSGQRSAE